MPNNNKSKNTANKTAKTPRKRVKYFEVILNLTFEQHHESADDLEKEDQWNRDESNEEFCKRISDWVETDKKYGTKDAIEKHIKENDAMDMVENLFMTDAEVISAKWLPGMIISFVLKVTDPNVVKVSEAEGKKVIEEDLRMTSLEDGEYESSGDNGWTVKTLKETMEYGLTDYRRNPMIIHEVPAPKKPRVKKTTNQTRRRR